VAGVVWGLGERGAVVGARAGVCWPVAWVSRLACRGAGLAWVVGRLGGGAGGGPGGCGHRVLCL